MKNFRIGMLAATAFCAVAPLFTVNAHASLVEAVAIDPANQPGNYAFSGYMTEVFTTANDLTLTSLGAFTGGAGTTFTNPGGIRVALFDVTGGLNTNNLLANYRFSGGDPTSHTLGSGSSVFHNLATPITLQKGHSYAVSAIGYLSGAKAGNVATGFPALTYSPELSFTGAYTGTSASGTQFQNAAGAPNAHFAAGTFAVASVPEASTWAMMIIGGLLLVGFQARRRKTSEAGSVPSFGLAI